MIGDGGKQPSEGARRGAGVRAGDVEGKTVAKEAARVNDRHCSVAQSIAVELETCKAHRVAP